MEFMDAKKAKTLKDVEDTVQKINEIQKQIDHPDPDGMIEALRNAKTLAPIEVTAAEFAQGDTTFTLWEDMPTPDLYRKLFQYRQALIAHGIAIVGKEAFEGYIKNQNKQK